MFNLDHDNFAKSKKALIAAAIAAAASYQISVENSEIIIFSIKISVSANFIRLTASLAFIYFASVFLLLYLDKYKKEKITIEEEIEDYKKSIVGASGEHKALALEKIRMSESHRRSMFIVDLGIPLITSILAVFNILTNIMK